MNDIRFELFDIIASNIQTCKMDECRETIDQQTRDSLRIKRFIVDVRKFLQEIPGYIQCDLTGLGVHYSDLVEQNILIDSPFIFLRSCQEVKNFSQHFLTSQNILLINIPVGV